MACIFSARHNLTKIRLLHIQNEAKGTPGFKTGSRWFLMKFLLETLIDSIEEGIIAIDGAGIITHFNSSAGRITGVDPARAVGRTAAKALLNSTLPRVLETGVPEIEKELVLPNNTRIIANRVPVRDSAGNVIGAVSIFRDVTQVTNLTDQNIALKQMQSLLEAIINASQDAVSVVDEKGKGLIINPAYTRLTGLTEKDVIGKPAEIDIAEGESAHMQVLRTRKPVRGARLKVKPHNKDVLVNVAPILVDGDLKGSVAIVHDMSELLNLSDQLSTARRMIRTLETKYTFRDIIGQSDQMQTAVQWAQKAAAVPATVLLRGESGTGKELFAHAIHHSSNRKNNQLIRVNCAAVMESLFESELFGYEEGAFTGARRGGKKGFFEEADKGTLFFDEVSELSTNTQAKLLRALQEKEIVRVGGAKAIPVDVRIIAATHVNLEEAVQEGRFRQDLYYRLNVMPIVIPPLRHRKEDLADLTSHIIRKLNQEFGRNVLDIDPEALTMLMDYPWYGNVRELENVLAQSMTRMGYTESTIRPQHLPELNGAHASGRPRAPDHGPCPAADVEGPASGDLKSVMSEVEKAYVIKILEKNRWNKVAAAKTLGISIRSLYNKIGRHGI